MSLSRPDTKAGRLQRALLGLLLEHQDDGMLPTNGRFLFYEAETRGIIPKAYRYADGSKRPRQPGQDVSDALTVLREAGSVPWSVIIDEGRFVSTVRTAPTVAEYLLDTVEKARIDPWGGDPSPVVLTESRSLAGVLNALRYEYAVPVTAFSGQCSGAHLANEVAPLFRDDDDDDGLSLSKTTRPVLYLGDFDLSGGHIERSGQSRLESFVDASLYWTRLAITEDQIHDHDLTVIEKVDHRFRPPRAFEAVETEALSQRLVVQLVRDALDEMLPEPLADVREREEQEQAAMRTRLEEA